MTPTRLLDLLLSVDLEGAACAGVAEDFVDPDPDDVASLKRYYCRTCPVLVRCRNYGDSLAPHRLPAVYGGRYYSPGEPADGWPGDPE